jgi:TetR/AcrR family transcriptional regulator
MASRTVEDRVQRPSADGTRERILAAALDLFSGRSFEGASTRLIAERAGVQQPLLTYHFGNREEPWRTAVGHLFEDPARALDERVDGLRGVDHETLAKLVVADFVRFSANHPQLHRIIMQE